MFVYKLISFILFILLLLVTVAFFTIAERKFMGSIQRRKGPDVVGFWGLLQAFADGLKLFLKEFLIPARSSIVLYFIGPVIVFFISISCWIVIPISALYINNMILFSLLYVYILTSFNIYGLFFAGWASNSRYAFLGGIRAISQMISYELVFGTINLFIILLGQSLNYFEILLMQQYSVSFIYPLFPLFFIFLIVMLAETNRTPFDLAEAEAELVAGYNVEYSSMMFAFFFLGEYSNMLFLSIIGIFFFFGGVIIPLNLIFLNLKFIIYFFFKILIIISFFIWIRATLPRYRYDQLMMLCWKNILPFLFSYFFLLIILLSLIEVFQIFDLLSIFLKNKTLYLKNFFFEINEFLTNLLKLETATASTTSRVKLILKSMSKIFDDYELLRR